MRAILIAVGNPIRRDDGVALAVLELLDTALDVESLSVHQLTPELAPDIAGYDVAIFLDADAAATEIEIGSVDALPASGSLTHVSTPAEVVALARALFGFGGQALACRIPVSDLSYGEGLSRQAGAVAAHAALNLELLLAGLGARFRAGPAHIRRFQAG